MGQPPAKAYLEPALDHALLELAVVADQEAIEHALALGLGS
jgi:hypothetical protein